MIAGASIFSVVEPHRRIRNVTVLAALRSMTVPVSSIKRRPRTGSVSFCLIVKDEDDIGQKTPKESRLR